MLRIVCTRPPYACRCTARARTTSPARRVTVTWEACEATPDASSFGGELVPVAAPAAHRQKRDVEAPERARHQLPRLGRGESGKRALLPPEPARASPGRGAQRVEARRAGALTVDPSATRPKADASGTGSHAAAESAPTGASGRGTASGASTAPSRAPTSSGAASTSPRASGASVAPSGVASGVSLAGP